MNEYQLGKDIQQILHKLDALQPRAGCGCSDSDSLHSVTLPSEALQLPHTQLHQLDSIAS